MSNSKKSAVKLLGNEAAFAVLEKLGIDKKALSAANKEANEKTKALMQTASDATKITTWLARAEATMSGKSPLERKIDRVNNLMEKYEGIYEAFSRYKMENHIEKMKEAYLEVVKPNEAGVCSLHFSLKRFMDLMSKNLEIVKGNPRAEKIVKAWYGADIQKLKSLRIIEEALVSVKAIESTPLAQLAE